MKIIRDIDLRLDTNARTYIKDETVTVTFAAAPGVIESREGANRFAIGDALITGSTQDRWSVSRDRFDAKYRPVAPLVAGQDGAYRNIPMPVFAVQIAVAFALQRSAGGDVIHGKAGDWLMQYAPGDFGIVDADKFRRVYRPT